MPGTMLHACPMPRTQTSGSPFMRIVGPYGSLDASMVALHRDRFGSAPRERQQWYVGTDAYSGELLVQGSVDKSGTLWNLSSRHEGRGNATEFVQRLAQTGLVRKLFVRGGKDDTERLLAFYRKIGFTRDPPPTR